LNIVRKTFPVGPLQCNCTIIGDTLFQGSVGRTDFAGGDTGLLKKSLQQRIYKLDENAAVVKGHGPETTIGQEMRFNAFVRA
jgi:hydroxyacylglutathione hydrolase